MRHSREPWESEIAEEIEERLQEEKESALGAPDDDTADLEIRLDELKAQMDATNERLEAKIDATNERLVAKIDACNARLETKIDSSNARMEAMFREILAGKASHADYTLTQSTTLPDRVNPVALEVLAAPTDTVGTSRPPSPTHVASGVSHPGGEEFLEVVAADDVGGGFPMDEAEGGGAVDVEANAITTAEEEVLEKVVQDDAYSIVDTQAAGEPAQKVK